MPVTCFMTIGFLCVSDAIGNTAVASLNTGMGRQIIIDRPTVKALRRGPDTPGWKASYSVPDVLRFGSPLPNKCAGTRCISFSVRCDAVKISCMYGFGHEDAAGFIPVEAEIKVESETAAGLALAKDSLAIMPDPSHPDQNLPLSLFIEQQ